MYKQRKHGKDDWSKQRTGLLFASGVDVPYHWSTLPCSGVCPSATSRGSINNAVNAFVDSETVGLSIGWGLYMICKVCNETTRKTGMQATRSSAGMKGATGCASELHSHGMDVNKVIAVAGEVASLKHRSCCHVHRVKGVCVRAYQPRLHTPCWLTAVAADCDMSVYVPANQMQSYRCTQYRI